MITTMDTQRQKPHILLIYSQMIPSIRLCGFVQLEDLRDRGIVEFRSVRGLEIKSHDLRWADVVIFGRSDSWYELNLARQLHKAGKHITYIIDDDLLNPPPYLASAAYLNRQDIRRNIQQMLAISDMIISPSPILLAKYAPADSGHKGILIEEPAILPVEYVPHDPACPVQIGFAGSIDRTQDIEAILKEALLKIKGEYGQKVSFCFYGAIPSFADELGATTIPYCDSYESYRETLNALQWDIGLAPMPETPFHRCKHYNKFVEYAASGIVGIYSDTEPYTRIRSWDNVGLFCANDSADWYRKIRYLLENREQLEAMRSQVCIYSHGVLSVQSSARELYRQLEACITPQKSTGYSFFFIPPYRIIHLFTRGFWFLVNHRKNLLSAVITKLRRG